MPKNTPPTADDQPAWQDYNQASLAHENGEAQVAWDGYNLLLKRFPNWADLWHQRAILAMQIGQTPASLSSFTKAIALQPGKADYHSNFGLFLENQQQWQDAQSHYEKAYDLAPDNPAVIGNLAGHYRQIDQKEKAYSLLKSAYESQKNAPEIAIQWGGLLREQGQYDEALDVLNKGYKEFPDQPEFLLQAAICLEHLGKRQHAIEKLQRHLEQDEQAGVVYFNLATLLFKQEQFDQALLSIEKATDLLGQSIGAHLTKANILHRMMRYDEADHLFRQILSVDEQNHECWGNLGNLYVDMQEFEKAHHCYERAVSIAPDNPRHIFQRGLQALREGNLPLGYDGYNAGFECNERFPLPPVDIPIWNPNEDFAGKTLFVSAEQGIGDEINAMTCLPDLMQLGFRVIWQADHRLHPILKDNYPNLILVDRDDTKPLTNKTIETESGIKADACYPISSLRQVFRPTLEDFPKAPCYIEPTQASRQRIVALLDQHFSNHEELRLIGFNPSSGLQNARRKAFIPDMEDWPTFNIPENYIFINLAYSLNNQDLEAYSRQIGQPIRQLSEIDLFSDIDGLFALMERLNHIITIGNSINDMAGILGCPATVLLPVGSAALLGQDFSPYYPNHTVIVREKSENWKSCLQKQPLIST